MKLLGRILIILAAAALISAVAIAIVQLSGASQSTIHGLPGSDESAPLGGGGDKIRQRDSAGTGSSSGQPLPQGSGRGRLGRQGSGDRERSSDSNFAGILRSLAFISLIVLLYWLGGKLFKLFKPKALPAGN